MRRAYKNNVFELFIKILNAFDEQNDTLTFKTLKYLATLLRDEQFAINFIDSDGLQVCLLLCVYTIICF